MGTDAVIQPSGAGQLATTQQLTTLFQTYGSADIALGHTGNYSPGFANLIAFFSNDAPAEFNNMPSDYSFGGFLQDSGYSNPIRVDDYGGDYSGTSPTSTDWSLFFLGTVDLLPVNNLAAFESDWCPNANQSCPTHELAFVVSTAAPVPLPDAALLLFSALGGWGALARGPLRKPLITRP